MVEIKKDSLVEHQGKIKQLLERKATLDSYRPIPTVALERIREELNLEWTYNSNAIEGNTLSLNETRLVLEEGLTVGGKSMREHFEVLNHKRALDILMDLVNSDKPIRSIDVLKLHEIVMKNIDEEFGGRIRNGMVRIGGANFTPPAPPKLSDLLDELVDYVNTNPENYDSITLSTIFHHRLVWIHPFFDGNGRTTRLAMNLILMRAGFPPAIILKNDRKKYYSALNAANKGDYSKLVLIMAQAIERSLNLYLNLLPKTYAVYEPLSSIVSEDVVPYGMEYVSLLARTGQINAHKEGRNWVSTKEEVMKYYTSKKKG
ncbi:MAG: Fic family protein [Leadbetterella sp.]